MGEDLTRFAAELAEAHRSGADRGARPTSLALARSAKAGDVNTVRAFFSAYIAAPAPAPDGGPPLEVVPPPARQLASFQRAAARPQPAPPPGRPSAEPDGTAEVDRAAVLAAIARRGLPFPPSEAPAIATPVSLPRTSETVLLRGPVIGDVTGGTVLLSSGAPPPLEVPFTIAPSQSAAHGQTLPFLPLETFAEIATAMIRGEDPAPLFVAHGVHPMQYLQCSGAFYERAASDPAFKQALDDAMARAVERRR